MQVYGLMLPFFNVFWLSSSLFTGWKNVTIIISIVINKEK